MIGDGDSSDAIEASEESSWVPARGMTRGEHEVTTQDRAKERAQGSIKAFFQELPLGEHILGTGTQTRLAQHQALILDRGGALLPCAWLSSLACMGVQESGNFFTGAAHLSAYQALSARDLSHAQERLRHSQSSGQLCSRWMSLCPW